MFSELENAPLWYQFSTYKAGERVYDISTDSNSPRLIEFGDSVKGTWSSGEYELNDYTFYAWTWHKVVSKENSSEDIPFNPNDTLKFGGLNTFSNGEPATNDSNQVVIAQPNLKGAFDPNSDYQVGDVVQHMGILL